MTGLLLDSALRTLVLALAVWAGLRFFSVRSVPAEKGAWTVVLAAALLMPLLLPLARHWPALTLELPAMAARPADTYAAPAPANIIPHFDSAAASAAPERAAPAEPAGSFSEPAIVDSAPGVAPVQTAAEPAREGRHLSLAALAVLFYFAVATALLFRLLYGLAAALRIWHAAEPVLLPGGQPGLRSSRAVCSPVTIGSAIVLPADYVEWDEEKLRIVLAHEGAHIRQGDFYLQLLAGMYAALVWFSPLGWWLQARLGELGEAISDRSGLEEAESRSSYAQVLLEFAAAPRPTLIGVAMARPSSLSRRIERLLNDRAFGQAFSGGRRAFAAALLIPAVLFAASALVRVQAAGEAQQSAPTPPPITGQSHPGAAAATVAPEAEQIPPQNGAAPAAAPKAGPAPGAEPAAGAKPGAPMHIDIPALHIDVPAVHVNIPATHINEPAVHVNVPAVNVNVPAVHLDVPARHIDIPAVNVVVPPVNVIVPPVHVQAPPVHVDLPPVGAQSSNQMDGALWAMLSGMGHALVRPARAQIDAAFDRTLTFNGKLDLHVMNAAGDIHLTRGPVNQVVIHARIHSNYESDADEVHAIAANPPIVQNGNSIRIGGGMHREGANHISIDYEIEAPADAALEVMSGSGDITDEGVGVGAKLESGSGDIVAKGLEGGFKAESGSGDIAVENAGNGDAKAETGSGNINVSGVHGALKADTGSGDITVSGAPVSAWKIETGSGNVEFSPGNAPLTLDASTGNGDISTDRAMATQVSSDRHSLRGNLNGGGPMVRIETGSGDIHIR